LTVRYTALGPDYVAARELLRLLADDLPPHEQIARAGDLAPPPPAGAEGALAELIREPDRAVATIAAQHAMNLGADGLAREIERARAESRLLAVPDSAHG